MNYDYDHDHDNASLLGYSDLLFSHNYYLFTAVFSYIYWLFLLLFFS